MKRILSLIFCTIICISINAQTIKIYKNGDQVATFTNTATNSYKAVFCETTNTEQKLGNYEYVDIGVTVKKDNVTKTVYFAKINAGMENKEPTQESDYYSSGWTEKDGCYFNQTNAIDANATGWKATWNAGVTETTLWRLPTKEELDSLISQTHSEWTAKGYHGASGYIFYKKSSDAGHIYSATDDAHIFLPAAGRFNPNEVMPSLGGCYWVGDVAADAMEFSKTQTPYILTNEVTSRELSVRPVFAKQQE